MIAADTLYWLAAAFFVIALLYAAVGQAGASGYLAAMGLFGLAPAVMKPTALFLNLIVAGIGTFQFWRGGFFSWRTFYPFAILGFPFSLAGGAVQLPGHFYYPACGAILLLSGLQMLRAQDGGGRETPDNAPPFLAALAVGAGIGFVSGTTGTGGGVFLAPVIVAMNWVDLRRMAAVTAAYNLLNSAAALLGVLPHLDAVPAGWPLWSLAVAVGGALGSLAGSRYLPDRALRGILAAVLVAAGIKLLF